MYFLNIKFIKILNMSQDILPIPGFKYWSSSKKNGNILLYHTCSRLCLEEECRNMNTIICEECLEYRNGYENMVTEHETKYGNYSQGYCSICIDYCGGCISFEEHLSNICEHCDNYRCKSFYNSHDTRYIITPSIYEDKYIIPFPNKDVSIMPSGVRGIIVIGYDIYGRQYYSFHNVNRYTVSKGQILYWEDKIDIPIKHNRVNIEHNYIMDEFY